MNRDMTEILSALQKSDFRARFRLKEKDIEYIKKKGLDVIRKHAVEFISARIAPANPDNDGRQTPMKNHPVFIAQHATATCCRGCIEKWHKIPKGRVLERKEIDYIIDLIMAWIEKQILLTGV
jgi:hypothetical protein